METKSIQDLPDTVLCLISEYLEQSESLLQFALVSKCFYSALQLRYRSLCLKNGYLDSNEHVDILKTQNFMTIYGKFSSVQSMAINLHNINLDPEHTGTLIEAPRKNSQGGPNTPPSTYVPFKHLPEIKQVFSKSNFFRLVLGQDGTAMIFPSSQDIETMVDPSNSSCKMHLMAQVPVQGITHACIGNRDFVLVARGKLGGQEVYHGVVEEKFEEDGEEGSYQQFIQTNQNHNSYRPRMVRVKEVYGPLTLDVPEGAEVKIVEMSAKCLAYVEAKQPTGQV